ncbi:MAG: hypothetical protein KDA81_20350, partial [Planctomycetaceae bacterium]|nr:hypothetical protein [Planctomycetaceae bacterium]
MDSRCLGSNKRVRRPVNRLLCFFTLLSFGCGDIELPQVDLPGIPKKEAPVVQDQPSTETPTPSTSPTAPAM